MPDQPYVLAIDQGTSSTKAVAVAEDGTVLATAQVPLGQTHPAPGQVEQDASEILASVHRAAEIVQQEIGSRVLTTGLSVQRESALLWDPGARKPLSPVLGWQDRRTSGAATRLRGTAAGQRVQELSGMPVDPMFSALKVRWLLDEHGSADGVAAGTLDAFLVSALCGGRTHEAGSASRTQLLDVTTGEWSEELLDIFGVPRAVLGEVADSDAPLGAITEGPLAGCRVDAVLGDSHAAMFGHGVRAPGEVKVTYGTGSSVLGLVPDGAAAPEGLVRTIAWARGGRPVAAVEGNILSTGATLVWLARLLATTPEDLLALAETAPADHGVDLVPAFAGLAAPWWDAEAVGLVSGLDQGVDRAVLARAAAESVALQVGDVLDAVERGGADVAAIHADGGPTRNAWLMQLQADLAGRRVRRSGVAELSALGAAHLAGLSAGVWTEDDLVEMPRQITEFNPHPSAAVGDRRDRWHAAVRRSRFRPNQENDS